MAVIETTAGDMIIAIPNCDCGSTGGCKKCQTRILTANPSYFLRYKIKSNRIIKYDDMGKFTMGIIGG